MQEGESNVLDKENNATNKDDVLKNSNIKHVVICVIILILLIGLIIFLCVNKKPDCLTYSSKQEMMNSFKGHWVSEDGESGIIITDDSVYKVGKSGPYEYGYMIFLDDIKPDEGILYLVANDYLYILNDGETLMREDDDTKYKRGTQTHNFEIGITDEEENQSLYFEIDDVKARKPRYGDDYNYGDKTIVFVTITVTNNTSVELKNVHFKVRLVGAEPDFTYAHGTLEKIDANDTVTFTYSSTYKESFSVMSAVVCPGFITSFES